LSCSIDQFRDRLVYQYRDSPKVVGTVDALLSEYPRICETLNDLLTRLDIDLSRGVQLDGIGEIVGRPRPNTEDLEPEDLLVLDGSEPGLGFSSLDQPTIGGRFIGMEGGGFGPMPDHDYRTLLRAAIFGNYATGSVQDVVDYAAFVLDARVFLVEDIGVVNFQFDRVLRPFEVRILLATVPLAAGVRIGTFTSYDPFILAGGETLETSDGLVYEVIISEVGP